jgi:hypothetical protein
VKYLVLDGKRYLWKDILRLRKEQVKAARRVQPVLFELQEDERPKSQRTASLRFEEPTLFGISENGFISKFLSVCSLSE